MSIDYANPEVWNDPAKDLWREKLQEFIHENLSFIKPKDMKVICLPGAGAREVLDVYLPLGIPARNITGIEADPKIAEQLRGMQLGIDIRQMYDVEFFRGASGRYHIVSLDYKGHCKADEQRSMELIAQKGLLGDCGILSTVYLAARESKALQEGMRDFAQEYLGVRMASKVQAVLRQRHETDIAAALTQIREMERFERVMPRNLAEIPQRIAKFQEAADHLNDLITRVHVNCRELATEELKVLDAKYDVPELNRARDSVPYMILSVFENGKLPDESIDEMMEKLHQIMTEDMAVWELDIGDIVKWRMAEGYNAKAIKRYIYRSNKGSPMMADMYLMKRDRKLIRDIDKVVSVDGKDISVAPLKHGEFFRTFIDIPWRIRDAETSFDLPEPEFLGVTNGKERGRQQTLSPETVLLLAESRSSKEIMELDPHYTPSRIAALKAHVTMGNYMKIDGRYMKTSELERMTAPDAEKTAQSPAISVTD